MLTVITLLKLKPSPDGEKHGERAFWGEYGWRYLAKWLVSVRRWIQQPTRVVVMTDDEVLQGIRLLDGEESVSLDKTVDAPGFWAKLNMFRPEVSTGKCLYLDLDNVVNGPLDELVALEPDPLIMLDDRRVPGLPNGSAILFDAERCRHLWTEYARHQEYCHDIFVPFGDDYWSAYDQGYIARNADPIGYQPPLFQDLLPDGYILNARSELPNATDWQNARLIFGCGSTKIHNSTHPGYSFK